ncbi:MAG: NUDIX hydrolase N-terminal domain-containing protein [Succinivibrionaceae bacterium]|nr:NUDIX hydrolase N-terminal domain-containing protein [Succinivibrionaceae bacterium]
MPRYSHVLVDLDGTLVDSRKANMEGMLAMFHRLRPGQEPPCDPDPLFGVPWHECLNRLGFLGAEHDLASKAWLEEVVARSGTVRPFPGAVAALRCLREHGIRVTVVTARLRHGPDIGDLGSCLPLAFSPYVEGAICADDVACPKPAPDQALLYLERTGARREEVLMVGDSMSDYSCATGAGIDFALAMWGTALREHLRCAHHPLSPMEVVSIAVGPRHEDEPWMRWTREMRAIAQSGLAYTENPFDRERFERLGELAAEMVALCADRPLQAVRGALSLDSGYATPKVETRGAVVNAEGEVLLVKERSGLWTLPGGWCDEGQSLRSNTLKEILEEAGMEASVLRLIALQNRNLHNTPRYVHDVIKAFFLCAPGRWAFAPNNETVDCRYFSEPELQALALRESTVTLGQLQMCLEAWRNPGMAPLID